jgi:hypothetical protein
MHSLSNFRQVSRGSLLVGGGGEVFGLARHLTTPGCKMSTGYEMTHRTWNLDGFCGMT